MAEAQPVEEPFDENEEDEEDEEEPESVEEKEERFFLAAKVPLFARHNPRSPE